MSKISIIDTNSGNIKSVANALNFLGCNFEITNDYKKLNLSSHLILPGVGAYGNLMSKLKNKNLVEPLKELLLIKKKFFLGICVGMQILSTKGFEFETNDGLNLIEGNVVKFQLKHQPIPHVGWNRVEFKNDFELSKGLSDQEDFYFVNSYYFDVKNTQNFVKGFTNYEIKFPSIVAKDNIFGVQFHPEKSQRAGLLLIKNFLNL